MNNEKLFKNVAVFPENSIWESATKRECDLYKHSDDKRSCFERDYTRILHSLGYRRMKHKTQVFFNTHNDHVCTRMEHVQHVASVSFTLANTLGLNTELTNAIATGHDLGHAPFGHQGETVLKEITSQFTYEPFFHEKNSLIFVDDIELLQDTDCHVQNLNLTYAVRDGLISHCGEVDENGLFPRLDAIDLRAEFRTAGQYQPYTWEGCVVKLSDKIAYLGRDIEDAARLGFLTSDAEEELAKIAEKYNISSLHAINTSGLINVLISDLCENSTPENGLTFSHKILPLLNEIKRFNYKHIYMNSRFDYYKEYVHFVLNTIYSELKGWYQGSNTFSRIEEKASWYEELAKGFGSWLSLYCDQEIVTESYLTKDIRNSKNKKIYADLSDEKLYLQAIVNYIAGMTDQYAITIFNSLTSF